jgi:hypothetical protein
MWKIKKLSKIKQFKMNTLLHKFKKIDRKTFYDSVRNNIFFPKLTVKQVEGIEAVFNKWDKTKHEDLRWLAYMLATIYHETARTMLPIEEFGKGKGKDYGKKLKMSRKPYTTPDKLYYGRGRVQLTWYENYEKMGKLLGIDLLNYPEKALNNDIDVAILFEGMLKEESNFGDFTGRCLEQYFNDKTEDPVNARKIINGLDKANLIAGYYQTFKTALKYI